MNWMKTFLLMGALTALALLIGDYFGGRTGMVYAFGIAAVMNFGSYWFSDKIVLTMYGAREVTESDAPRLFGVVRELAASANLPMPRVYIIPADQPNAFATGRDPNHAAVAVTEGIMRILNEEELQGVLAHELTHVKNRDVLIGTIAATIAGAIMMLSRMAFFFGGRSDDEEGGNPIAGLIALIVAPIAAMLIQMAISRGREFGADEGGAQISGKPYALANALRKLERGAEAIPMDANPATAHMFIMNPFSAGGLAGLFSTHPPTAERIARLERMQTSVG
jgi:heat shock protein HtpX